MRCPECGSTSNKVVDSRDIFAQTDLRFRRRECNDCGYRWNTSEIPMNVDDALLAVQHSGELQLLTKLRGGIRDAASKLYAAMETLEYLDELEVDK